MPETMGLKSGKAYLASWKVQLVDPSHSGDNIPADKAAYFLVTGIKNKNQEISAPTAFFKGTLPIQPPLDTTSQVPSPSGSANLQTKA